MTFPSSSGSNGKKNPLFGLKSRMGAGPSTGGSDSQVELRQDENGVISNVPPPPGSKGLSLLDKIKDTLANTKPDRWDQAGEPLDSSRKYQKAQDTWEQLYCTDVKNGVLVLRCSTPTRAQYFGGGYSFSEAGLPLFYVEIRPRGWAPKMIVDPYYRTAGGMDKRVETLVQGEIARHLYLQVEATIREYREGLKRDFSELVDRLAPHVAQRVRETSSQDWEVVASDRMTTHYRADVEGLQVDVWCELKDNSCYYNMRFSRFGHSWESRDSATNREVFSIVDEAVRNTSLEQLDKVLEEML